MLTQTSHAGKSLSVTDVTQQLPDVGRRSDSRGEEGLGWEVRAGEDRCWSASAHSRVE